jgi:hypothetical protein
MNSTATEFKSNLESISSISNPEVPSVWDLVVPIEGLKKLGFEKNYNTVTSFQFDYLLKTKSSDKLSNFQYNYFIIENKYNKLISNLTSLQKNIQSTLEESMNFITPLLTIKPKKLSYEYSSFIIFLNYFFKNIDYWNKKQKDNIFTFIKLKKSYNLINELEIKKYIERNISLLETLYQIYYNIKDHFNYSITNLDLEYNKDPEEHFESLFIYINTDIPLKKSYNILTKFYKNYWLKSDSNIRKKIGINIGSFNKQ